MGSVRLWLFSGLMALSVTGACSSDDSADASGGAAGTGGGIVPTGGTAGTAGGGGTGASSGSGASGGSSGTAGAGGCGPIEPGTTTPHPWAEADPAACSEADLAALEILGANEDPATFTADHASCGACLFSSATDATWTGIVLMGTSVIFNSPACIDARGGSIDCANKLNAAVACQAAACEACGEQSASDGLKCLNAAAILGGCAALVSAENGCVQTLGPETNPCFPATASFGGALRSYAEVLCAGAVPDAGDAAAADAGDAADDVEPADASDDGG